MANDLREVRADARAEKARAKAMRPWFKKKRFILPIALAVIMILMAVSSGGGDDKTTTTDAASGGGTSSSDSKLFPGRADVKKNDKERNIGQSADLSGYTVTVTTAAFQQQLSQFEKDGYLVADVTLANRDSKAQSYNTFDWKLLTPQGQIIDPCLCSKQLGSGDLANGGNISGSLTWEVGAQKGNFYVIYEPSGLGEDRGVWQVTA